MSQVRFNTVHVHAYGDVGSLVDHMRAVTDLDHQRVQTDSPGRALPGADAAKPRPPR